MRAEAVWINVFEVELSTPYNADFVAALKGAIPARHRRWDPESKAWSVFGNSRQWADHAVALLLDYFPNAHIAERPERTPGPWQACPPHALATDPDFAALHLLPSAPPALVVAAYKILAKYCHPDRGGTEEQMRSLNLAMDHLRQRGAA
jgi:hypothetical protein